jgi:hypothetical protein
MINHYVNLMEADKMWEMTFAEEGAHYILNSGMFIAKNSDWTHQVFAAAMDIGVEDRGLLARNFGHEQGAIIEVRKRWDCPERIRVLPHRESFYNLNTFFRFSPHDPVGARFREGDAFVHFLGLPSKVRHEAIQILLEYIHEWRLSIPSQVIFPIDLPVTK